MSKRNKGQRARARRSALLSMRAELAILLENRLAPHHLQLNTHSTRELLEHVREFNYVPMRFAAFARNSNKLLDEHVFEDVVRAFDQGVNSMLLTGTGIVRLTTDQQPGTIMDMDSGNAPTMTP